MTEDPQTRILVVANRTASTPALLGEVERRAKAGARCSLLIPPEGGHQAPDWTPEDATRLLGRAARSDVGTVDPGPAVADTIHRLVAAGEFDAVIVSTVAEHHDHWFHHNLPHRLGDLGVPVTVIPPEPHKWGPIEGFPPDWVPHAASPAGMAGFGNY